MTGRCLAIGECMIELSPAKDGHFAMGFAGDTFNTAWYLKRLVGAAMDVAYLSAVGDDTPSVAMSAFMEQSGIRPELTVQRGGHAGLYMISLKDGERSFSYWRDTSAARTLADDLTSLPGVGTGDTAFFSGITLGVLPDQGRTRLLSVLAQARADGVRVVFDPNLRPRLWADADEMRHWISEGAKVADIALPSYEDEAEVFSDASKEATAKRYSDAGAGIVIVKDGPGPVLITDGAVRAEVTPESVLRPVDTTAAGDAFNAGVLAGLDAGFTLDKAVRCGCRVSARVIAAPGALVDIPELSALVG